MTDAELKALTSKLLSLTQDMKDPTRLPEEGYRCYWRGVGDAVSAMFDIIGKVLEGEESDESKGMGA